MLLHLYYAELVSVPEKISFYIINNLYERRSDYIPQGFCLIPASQTTVSRTSTILGRDPIGRNILDLHIDNTIKTLRTL